MKFRWPAIFLENKPISKSNGRLFLLENQMLELRVLAAHKGVVPQAGGGGLIVR